MHELSIAMSILDIAGEESERHGAARIHAIHLRLGPLAGVIQDALTSAFELARETSPFAETRLVIEAIPVTIRCSDCQSEQPVVSIQEMRCARCGTFSADVVRGRELEIVGMEIEEEEPPASPEQPQGEQ